MEITNNPIKFTSHSIDSMKNRGAIEAEVIQTINEGTWKPAKSGRFECSKNFSYNSYWNGKYYNTKQVMPVFKEENNNIIVITVYVFYF